MPISYKWIIFLFVIAISLSNAYTAELSDIDSSYVETAIIESSQESHIFILPTDNGFGIWPGRIAGGVYSQYSSSGKLLWTFKAETNHRQGIYKANVSGNGKILAFCYFKGDGSEYGDMVCEVIRSSGDKLSKFIVNSVIPLRCSWNGVFLFNAPDPEESICLIVYSQNGDLLLRKEDTDWMAEAISDSLLFYSNYDSMFIINVFTGNIIKCRESSFLKPSFRPYANSACSPLGNAVALWAEDFGKQNRIVILDKELNLISSFAEDSLIHTLVFSKDSDYLAYESYQVALAGVEISIRDYFGKEVIRVKLPRLTNEYPMPFPGYLQLSSDYLVLVLGFKSREKEYDRSFIIPLAGIGYAAGDIKSIDSWAYYNPYLKQFITFKNVNEGAIRKRISIWDKKQ